MTVLDAKALVHTLIKTLVEVEISTLTNIFWNVEADALVETLSA